MRTPLADIEGVLFTIAPLGFLCMPSTNDTRTVHVRDMATEAAHIEDRPTTAGHIAARERRPTSGSNRESVSRLRRHPARISLLPTFLRLLDESLEDIVEAVARFFAVVQPLPGVSLDADVHVVFRHVCKWALHAHIPIPTRGCVQQVQSVRSVRESYLCNACMHTYEGNR